MPSSTSKEEQATSPGPVPGPGGPDPDPARQDLPARPSKKTISNPRRLLILSPTSHSQTTIPPLLRSLTGVSPPPQPTTSESEKSNGGSFVGYTTHAPLHIETKYYAADVPIWVDEILVPLPLPVSSDEDTPESSGAGAVNPAAQWRSEFLSAEAQVVRDAIGALVICVKNPVAPASAIPKEAYAAVESVSTSAAADRADVRALKDLVRMIGDVKSQTEEERGENGEVPGVLVLMGQKPTAKNKRPKSDEDDEEEGEDEVFSAAWWEDELYDMGVFGFEVVAWDPRLEENEKRNRFGEYEGLRRVKEVLETNEWSASTAGEDNDDDLDFLNPDDDGTGFGLEVDQLEREMMGLRFAFQKGDGGGADEEDDNDQKNDELRVEEQETLMLRMRAIKDMSADLPESQRKAFASKAVRDLMREL